MGMLNTGVFIDCFKQNTVLPYLYPRQAYSGFKFDASPATPNSMTNRAQAIAAATAHFDDGHYFHELQRRIARRTESDTGQAPAALTDYLVEDIVPTLQAMGFDCQVLPNSAANAGPFLIARRIEGAMESDRQAACRRHQLAAQRDIDVAGGR